MIEYLLESPNYKKIDCNEQPVPVSYLIKCIEIYPELFDATKDELKSICEFCMLHYENSKYIVYQTNGCVFGCRPEKLDKYEKSIKKIAVIYDTHLDKY